MLRLGRLSARRAPSGLLTTKGLEVDFDLLGRDSNPPIEGFKGSSKGQPESKRDWALPVERTMQILGQQLPDRSREWIDPQ